MMKFYLILTAALGVATSATAAAPSGQGVFDQRCSMCHSLQPAPGKMGPPLAGVVGRKAGATTGYGYSSAMKAYGVTWSPEALDAFLKAPNKAVPGTKMLIGAPDAEDRTVVIQYLKSFNK